MIFSEIWEPVIGLEIHAQLKTSSKSFSDDSSEFGNLENENISPVSLGLPGALPVLNKKAVEFSIRAGLALNCKINNRSVFSRKNYFYPDLPKGYQISQFDEPLCSEGFIEFFLEGKKNKIRIHRAHMEEDAGKSIHEGSYTLINLNRAGVPLLEIVSEPDLSSPAQAAEYARTVRNLLRYIDVCDGNLEEGSLRCDCNVSVRKKGDPKLGQRTEIKNINSFRFIEKAIEFEIHRQIDAIESGEKIIQETRLYDSTKNKTFSMRIKEDSADYRYFPDPDLLPLDVSPSWIKEIQESLPELPTEKFERFCENYKLPEYDSQILTQEKDLALFFEETVSVCKNAKSSSNWVMGELLKKLNESKKSASDSPVTSKSLGEMILLIDTKVISGKMAKKVFELMWQNPSRNPEGIVKDEGLVQISDSSVIEKIADDIITIYPDQVKSFQDGKDKLFGFFVGQVMKASKGQANPEMLNKILKEKLEVK